MLKLLLTQLTILKKLNTDLSNQSSVQFLKCGNTLINIAKIEEVDIAELENLSVKIKAGKKIYQLEGIEAIEAVLLLKPQSFEGLKLNFPRKSWLIHNLIAHPGMQILSLLGMHELAFKLHDGTIPKPLMKVQNIKASKKL